MQENQNQFSAVLLPHRSLSRKGFIVLMTFVCLVSFAAGVAFMMMGAWPVTGLFGLDVIIIYLAFRMNYRAGRQFETVELDGRELRVTRVYPSGKSESWTFNPFWVRIDLEEHETKADVLSLRQHAERLVFGAFLPDAEKKEFAETLARALAAHREGPMTAVSGA